MSPWNAKLWMVWHQNSSAWSSSCKARVECEIHSSTFLQCLTNLNIHEVIRIRRSQLDVLSINDRSFGWATKTISGNFRSMEGIGCSGNSILELGGPILSHCTSAIGDHTTRTQIVLNEKEIFPLTHSLQGYPYSGRDTNIRQASLSKILLFCWRQKFSNLFGLPRSHPKTSWLSVPGINVLRWYI